jgi:hypothetical protein
MCHAAQGGGAFGRARALLDDASTMLTDHARVNLIWMKMILQLVYSFANAINHVLRLLHRMHVLMPAAISWHAHPNLTSCCTATAQLSGSAQCDAISARAPPSSCVRCGC